MTEDTMGEPWTTVAEIAEQLQISEATVRAWLRAGRLPGRNLGGQTGWRVRESALEAFLAATPGHEPVADEKA
jgi:excisionase family DNA binding protein